MFTPNIDNLAREGMRFDCAVAGAPCCTPFRGALLTERYPHQSGVVANGCPLPPDMPTVAHTFDGAGYHTAYVGKWHLDGTNDRDHTCHPDAAAALEGQRRRQQPARVLRVRHRQRDAGAAVRL